MDTATAPEEMRTLTIIGRRWFRRGPGGTYHTAQIIVNGRTVHKTEEAYGYGEGYEQSAWDWLEANGYALRRRYGNGGSEAPWQYCQDRGITYERQAIDVPREKDL